MNKLKEKPKQTKKVRPPAKRAKRRAPNNNNQLPFIRLEHRAQVLQIQLMASADHLDEGSYDEVGGVVTPPPIKSVSQREHRHTLNKCTYNYQAKQINLKLSPPQKKN